MSPQPHFRTVNPESTKHNLPKRNAKHERPSAHPSVTRVHKPASAVISFSALWIRIDKNPFLFYHFSHTQGHPLIHT